MGLKDVFKEDNQKGAISLEKYTSLTHNFSKFKSDRIHAKCSISLLIIRIHSMKL